MKCLLKICVCVCAHTHQVTSVMFDSFNPTDCNPPDLLCPWDSPHKNTGRGCYALLQGNFLNPGIIITSLTSPALAGGFFTTSATWEACSLFKCVWHTL